MPEQRFARLQRRVAELEAESTKLTTEREILARRRSISPAETNRVSRVPVRRRPPRRLRGEAVDCELVEVERSSFYAWLKAAPAREARAAADAELVEKISADAEDNTIGAPRATAEVNAQRPGRRNGSTTSAWHG